MSDIHSAAACGKRSLADSGSHRARREGAEKAPSRLSVKLRLDGDCSRDLSFEGRDAWALIQLLKAGESGCTPIDVPGPRWSHYVYKLRRGALNVETVTELHGGPFAGHHARYVLRSKVHVLEISDPQRQGLSVHDGGRS